MENKNSSGYLVGRLLGRLPWWAWTFALAAAAYFLFVGDDPQASKVSTSAPAAQVQQTPTIFCENSIEKQTQKYVALVNEEKFWAAANEIRACASLLKEKQPELMTMVTDAEVKSLLADINNPKKSPFDRASAMQALGRDHPEIGAKYQKQMQAIFDSEDKKTALAEKKRKKSAGVSLGMSQDDVYASSWGRPNKINRTTASYGVHEQWVYDGGGYLYFEDGVLTTIQN